MRIKLRLCMLLSVAVFTSCSPAQSEPQSKNNSQEYEIITNNTILLENFFDQEEDDYLVFVHSDTCAQCKEIIGDVVTFANDNIRKTYFLNMTTSSSKITKVSVNEITVGVSSVVGLVYVGTPTIYEVVNKTTTANIGGKDKCLTFLNEIRKNSEI